MDIIVLIFSPGFMLFVWLVPVRANGGLSAKRQEFQVERSAVDTEPDRVHCSFGCAEDAANGDPFVCVPAIRADEDYLWVLPSLHFLWASLSFSQERREGVGSRRINLYPSLSVRVPTLSPHAVSWVGT